MNNLRNNLYNDFWDWIDCASIKYKNYEIKNSIIKNKYSKYIHLINNLDRFTLREFLASVKWKLKLNLLKNKMPKNNILLEKNYDSIYDLSNKNLYAINSSPNTPRVFLHIAPLVKSDDFSLVITVRNDVYAYFNKIKKPVILLNISNPWRNQKDLEIKIPSISSEKKLLLSLDLFTLVSLSRAASLIDLLDIITNEYGLPKTLITIQDFHAFDSVFATYYKGKVPTITLQHGRIRSSNADNLWKHLISDWMIVFGSRQAEILKYMNVSSKKLKVLGTAKYDLYSEMINIQQKNKNKRILIGFQHAMFKEQYNKQIYCFLEILLNSKGNFLISIRFHPGILKKKRKYFIQKLKKMNSNYRVNVEISNIKDPIEDISKSAIILTSKSTLGTEAMLLRKPIIEYLSSKRNDGKEFKDYRDFVLHAPTGKDAEVLILKLFNSDNFYNNVIEKQNKFTNLEILPPPAIPRILNFINSLNDNKRE